MVQNKRKNMFEELQQKMVDLVDMCYQEHKSSFENWHEGDPVTFWFDSDKNLCIKYASGEWFHYKINQFNELIWW